MVGRDVEQSPSHGYESQGSGDERVRQLGGGGDPAEGDRAGEERGSRVRAKVGERISDRAGGNGGRRPYQGSALPLSYVGC